MNEKNFGHYEVVEMIGRGGMGEVYRARDTRLERDVAIKLLPPEFAKDPERLARFRREARLLASLHHTHIAAMHGLEETEDGIFLVMELVEGEDLSERIERGALDLEDALDLARQFAEGLEVAHEKDIVHRDLKPANLKITPDGTLKILDFGLARAYLGDQDDEQEPEHSPTITAALTGHGVILGTAAYMSPEQARGRAVDQRTDIWAFGAILFEMLSGIRIFTGETISDTMAAVLRAEPPWDDLPSDTPIGVRRLLERCLERDGRRRLRDIGEARVRLERWREDPTTMTESYVGAASGPMPVASSPSRLPWVLVALLAIVAGYFGVQSMQAPESEPRLRYMEIDVAAEDNIVGAGVLASISPDGQWLAWNTTSGIWLRRMDQPEGRLIDETRGAFGIGFSPDSRWLGFTWRGSLHRVSVQGGAPIEVCAVPTPRGFTWVDESTIVFTPAITSGLSVVDLTTGETRAVTSLDNDTRERSHRWPSVVPGTRNILFEVQFLGRDYDQSDIRMLSLDTGEITTIYRGGAAPRATNAGQLLFVQDNTMFAIAWDGDGPISSGLPVPVLDNIEASVGNQEDDDGSAQYSIDLEGNLLYVDQGAREGDISQMAWIDYATGDLTPLGPPSHSIDAVLSSDGTLVAISRHREGNDNIYIHELATGNETMLTHRESVEYSGAFSRDSKTFYWSQASDRGDKFEIWRRPVDGSEPAEFVAMSPHDAGFWAQSMSPDGRWLGASAWTGVTQRDVFVVDLENLEEGPQLFVGGEGNQSQIGWLNDDFVFYTEDATPAGELRMRRFPDTGAVWTFPANPEGYFSAWPNFDGTALIATAPDGIYRLPVDTSDGNVSIGRASLLEHRSTLDQARFAGEIPYPDESRSIVWISESSQDEFELRSLVYVTGWVQDVTRKVRQDR